MLSGRNLIVIAMATTVVMLSEVNSRATTFTSANLDDTDTWSTVFAQGFSPSINASPNPGLSAGDAVALERFDFLKSGTPDSASNIQLAIVDSLFYDYTNQLTTSSSAFVGISSNTVASTAPIATGDRISFSFGSLPLTYGSDYAAVFVNDDGQGNLTPALVSAMTENYVEDPPNSGNFVPATNYGADDEFIYATSNFINNGFFNTFSFAGDAGFEATFTAVPEPSSFLLAIFSMAAVLARKRARS